MKTLLIGAARSGKSSLAARWAAERATDVCCLVTATESDPEMSARIAAHRRERPAHWRVREEPLQLGRALREESGAGGLVLIDCLTVWVANCLWPPGQEGDRSPDLHLWERERESLLRALGGVAGEVFLITNEVGAGIVPVTAAGRTFRDEHGRLNQSVAAMCDEVFLITAGLPLCLKPSR